jgi:uncharacterized membrane protein
MESWLIFALANAFISWLYNFTHKIAAERNYNISIMTIYTYLVWIIIFWTYLLFKYQNIDFFTIKNIAIFAFWNSLFFILSIFSRIKSMKNIDTVIFFPLYKTFWPILVTLLSIFYFKETLEPKEIIGIIIWIIIPLMLITNSENKRQKNLYLWVVFILITSVLTAISSWISKEFMLQSYNIVIFLFVWSIFWLIFSIFSYYYFNSKKKKYNNVWIWKFSIICWVLHAIWYACFTLALTWNLAVVFTISSFSILIPIILSIIFYKDHFDLKKWLIIILSIISIILFI